MSYFLTGASGFIGGNLVPLLLRRTARRRAGEEIVMLVRASSLARLNERIEHWSAGSAAARRRLRPVVGDLHEPMLGLEEALVAELRERGIRHFFHLAAVYDMRAGEETNHLANVEGTQHALALAAAIRARVFHHVSSVAVA
ncbi:MAG TPA: SDR family oxidoreductase, partial [Solirubrobacteraceae bacterium]|nr:SDR family oxidoreductase [Solirubrobacteraceae bacterium]